MKTSKRQKARGRRSEQEVGYHPGKEESRAVRADLACVFSDRENNERCGAKNQGFGMALLQEDRSMSCVILSRTWGGGEARRCPICADLDLD